MELEKVTQEILDELAKETEQSKKNGLMLEGAMQGVRLLYQKIKNEEATNNAAAESSKSESSKKQKKS